jgi:hypothetical protein
MDMSGSAVYIKKVKDVRTVVRSFCYLYQIERDGESVTMPFASHDYAKRFALSSRMKYYGPKGK